MATFKNVESIQSGSICISDSLCHLRKTNEINIHDDSNNSLKLQKDLVEEQKKVSDLQIKSSCSIAMGAIPEGGNTNQTNKPCIRQTSSPGDEQPGQELSHAEMKEVFHKAISQLLAADPILDDLHPDITHEEVQGLLEVSCGLSMLVLVQRADGGQWQVRVPCDARLHQLKAALRTHVTLSMHRQGCRRPLSWRNVWRRHWLVLAAGGERLKDDNATLHSLGVRHRSVLSFVKRDREKKTKQRERHDIVSSYVIN